MMLSILMTCNSCLHTNQDKLGMPGFEVIEYRFTAFSEAHQHMIKNPTHYIDISIYDESEDD